MRISKEHGERKAEILAVAEALFAAKGFSGTTISDVLDALGIAKGTFYYYFASKEALMDGVIERYLDTEIAAAKTVAETPQLTAHEKMFRILSGAGRDAGRGDRLEKEARALGNADMHQRTMSSIVLRLSPILEGIVRQGMREGAFTTAYPKECVEILLAASEFLLHGSAFSWSGAERAQKARALAWMAEKALGAEEGRFSYLYEQAEEKGRDRD
jgi:Transcriptional regulator